MVLGAIYAAVGVLVAHNGFTLVGPTATAGLLLALWFLLLAVNLWRRAGEQARPSDPSAGLGAGEGPPARLA